MAANEDYLSLSIKRQALLERVKSGQVRDFAKEIKKIETLVRQTLLGLDDELSRLSQSKFNKLLAQLRADQLTIYDAATATFLENAATIAGVAAAGEIVALEKTVDLRGTRLDELTKKEAFSKVLKRPMTTSGQLLEPWIKDFSTNEIKRVNGAIRNGWATGKTNQEMVQQLIGTKSKNYKDGILQTTRRNASTVVRTSVQHVASTAQYETWEENRDVVKQYQWVATLDGDTSADCRALDGDIFDFGKGPIPPIHPNCRSATIPVLDKKFDFISKGRTRSAEDGPTSAKTTYYDWLKRQDEATQIQVLGPKRAKLFRDGGMSAKRFKDLQFDKNFEPLTLDQMQKIEPEAFRRAGLSGTVKPLPKPKPKPIAKPKPKPKTKKPEKKAPPKTTPLESLGKKFNAGTSSLRRNKIDDAALAEIEDGLSVFENNYSRIQVHTKKDRRMGGAIGAHITKQEVSGKILSEDISFRKDLLTDPDLIKKVHRRNLEERAATINTLESRSAEFADDPATTKRIKKMLKEQKAISRYGVSTDSSNPIKTVAAHEAGHAISKSNRFKVSFAAELEKNKVSKIDKLSLSEYAASDNDELFAEVTAAIYTGRKNIVPKNIQNAFTETLKKFPEIKTKGLID